MSELAFGAAVSLGGAGSIAVGAWLLVERGGKPSRVAERSAVLFLLDQRGSTSSRWPAAAQASGVWVGLFPGRHDLLLSLLPGGVGVLVFIMFMMLPFVR